MIRTLALTLGLGAMIALAGCYRAPVMPPPGYIYADIGSIVDTAPMGETLGSRTGRATSQSILGLIAQGDCSVSAAAAVMPAAAAFRLMASISSVARQEMLRSQ